MAMDELNFGDRLMGHLVDGVEGTPYQAAVLHLSEQHGVRVEVPYVSRDGGGQFEHVERWFRGMSVPSNLLLHTANGPVSLFGVTWAGYSENSGQNLSLGNLKPAEAVLAERDGELSDGLTVQTVRSRLDGLNDWTGLEATDEDRETDEEHRIRTITYRLRSPDELVWSQGEATMTLRADWTAAHHTDGYNRAVELSDNVVLESAFVDGPRSFHEHFAAQRKIASLLVFLYGRPISFREHRVQDERFASRLLNGKTYNHPFVELISDRTVRERLTPVPSRKELDRPLAHMTQIGADGLATWAANYDTWRRFILPSAGVLGRRGAFIEDRVVSTSMSLEAAGGLIGKCPGEEETYTPRRMKTTATYVFRCLYVLRIGWGDYIASDVGLARAIANNYNDVKHADRGDFPDSKYTYLVSSTNSMLVRLLALYLTGKGDDLLKFYRNGRELWSIQQRFGGVGVRVTDEGKWEEVSNEDNLRDS
ncbi:hypothetical protein [Curtobacterium sp. MCBD17_019]|uniref:ApeA N-terminal domain 1-containing protein n=1 Tax=Curtobacterium sp. MCBD17_019 TaxID=2175669 RepID=UPI000DA976F8|nr:hypothetical protein [Curtobacterium sp. MCBD17_019]PZE71617.1 hypothetical protein DEI82_15125 [Curtobacterium sp. MCBD17_019]